MTTSFDTRMAESYAGLSPRLRQAADHVAANPVDTVSRGLRAIAAEARLAPATFTRMAHALGYDSFEDLREALRIRLTGKVRRFAARAEEISQETAEGGPGLLQRYREACTGNIDRLCDDLDPAALDAAAARLAASRRVVLVGALGSLGPATYGAYMGRFLGPGWELAGQGGISLGATLAEMGPQDALVAITKPPSARATIRAMEAASRHGTYTLLLTDSHACPALPHATAHFIIPDETPNFFSSYVATLFLLETLVALVARQAGPGLTERITRIEAQSRLLEEVVDS